METINQNTGEITQTVPPGILIEKTAESDPFADLAKLRVSQDFLDTAGVQKMTTKILVRKPAKQEFIRTHSNPESWFTTYLLVVDEDREFFIVAPSLVGKLEGDVKPYILAPTISRQGNVFLWPIPLSNPDSAGNNWHCSALEAAKIAREKWTRIYFKNLAAGQYEVLTARAEYPDPQWPEHSLNDYLRLGFGDRVIMTTDHQVIKRLQGEE
ncbi:MAG: hypothetical protein ACXWRU_12105 [Pseudobdellovibrionaceae bacterium]